MNFIRVICYSFLMEYHLKKRKNIRQGNLNLSQHHFEMAKHYYEKVFGEKYESKK